MKFCSVHWNKLCEGVNLRGLGHLVTHKEEESIDVDNVPKTKNYDPLINLHWSISLHAVQMGGLYLLSGDYCPVCEAIETMVGREDVESEEIVTLEEVEYYWLEAPLNAELKHCKDKGIIPRLN